MKKILLTLLACMTFIVMALAASCSSKSELMFNEGYLEEVVLGEPIMLDEYIDPNLTDDYTAILTFDETGMERDLKMLGQWTTDKPGRYTLTYTVNSGKLKGTISTKISVVVPTVTWQYSRPTLVYRAGETMEFNLFKRNLNLLVNSYYDYDFFVKSVQHDGVKTDVAEQSSYTFENEGDHIFTFAIRTKDGQELFVDQKISVRARQILADGAQEWMTENGITVHDHTFVSPDGKVSVDAGYYNNNFLYDNVPYIAFNGVAGSDGYGANTYAMVDFTGKNLPQVAFFCDGATSSFTDGKNGILFSNGTSLNSGKLWSELDASRLTIFGPNKASYAEFDNRGRMLALGSLAEPCPMGYNLLNDGDSYRYIIGIENARVNSITARILLVNLTTGERVFDLTKAIGTYFSGGAGDDGKGNTYLNLVDYFKGSIVLYGRYGLKTEFDKVYLPITGIDDIYELDEAAEFKDNYKANYELNSTANMADYINIPLTDYEFKVTDPDGELVEIAADGSFRYTKSGTYRLFFDPRQDDIRGSSVTVRVLYDLENPLAEDFLENEGAIMAFGDNGVKINTDVNYVTEGSQSIQYYTKTGKDGKITVYLSKSFMEFVFLSRKVQGITFKVYSEKAVDFNLSYPESKTLKKDYTGSISAMMWTTLTVSRDLCMKNYETYRSGNYSLAIALSGDAPFAKDECVYIDDIALIIDNQQAMLADDAQAFMTQNNMTAYGYQSITADMRATLNGGIYEGYWDNIKNDDVPYIAYNGNYGTGTYVVVDFTGKNIPQLCFFAKDVTSSIVDGLAGIYVHTGMVERNGESISNYDGSRVTFLGPNKMEYTRPDADGRLGHFGSPDDSAPISINGLEDGVRYRYVIGIKNAIVGRIELEILLINLDTAETVWEYTQVFGGSWITADYISGNIVMYGRYNTAITLDKVYAVYENVSDINVIDKVAEVLGA